MSRKIAASALPLDAKGKDGLSALLDDLEAIEGELSDWERGFVSSLQDKIASPRFQRLTDPQFEILERIRERHGL